MTEYDVILSDNAERDLNALSAYIESQAGARIAYNYIERIEAKVASLAHSPLRGTLRAEFGPNVRTVGFERRATILFRVERKARRVVVLGVAYGGRRLSAVDE